MDEIASFRHDHAYLSNFFQVPIVDHDIIYPSSEHMYQALKTTDVDTRRKIAAAETASAAKALGQKVALRPHWDRLKYMLMEDVLRMKFDQHPTLAVKLAATGTDYLVEGNTWHDQIWGDCLCPQHGGTRGRNALGIILMRIRLDLQER
jgi:ribA/ribD-fused uncharacterized protein